MSKTDMGYAYFEPTNPYTKQGDETPFETYLKYTDQKIQTSLVVAKILNKHFLGNDKLSLLDIGAGSGDLIIKSVKDSNLKALIDYTLLENSDDLAKLLESSKKAFPNSNKIEIINQDWFKWHTSEKFDCILMSHAYFISPDHYKQELDRIIKMISNNGIIVIIMRTKDDVYKFKKVFKSKIFNTNFEPATIDSLSDLVSLDLRLSAEKFDAKCKLTVPVNETWNDAQKIIEFLLNKEWNEISVSIRSGILKYLQNKNYNLKQNDGILVLRKTL